MRLNPQFKQTMKFSNQFRIVWWLLLLGVISVFLAGRYGDLIAGRSTNVDAVAALIWVALALAPIFQEINLPGGIGLKQTVERLSQEVAGLRAVISNTVAVNPQFNPIFNLLPPDTSLPFLEDAVRRTVEDVLARRGAVGGEKQEVPSPPDNAQFLFQVRYGIDREMQRIWDQLMEPETFRHPVSGVQMGRELANEGLLDFNLFRAVQDVYSIASQAIHGNPVTDAQLSFARDVGPQVLAALRVLP